MSFDPVSYAMGKKAGGGGSATLIDKTIAANGEYDPADDSADGYSGVTVAVPQTGAQVVKYGPYKSGDKARSSVMSALAQGVSNSERVCLIKTDDGRYFVEYSMIHGESLTVSYFRKDGTDFIVNLDAQLILTFTGADEITLYRITPTLPESGT